MTGQRSYVLFIAMISSIPHNLHMEYFLQDRNRKGEGVHMMVEGRDQMKYILIYNIYDVLDALDMIE